MRDPDRRDASLDLTCKDFGSLLAGVTALVEQEVAAARSGPVFERPPSAGKVDRLVGADRALAADGESVEELLPARAAVLAAGRRTTPTFFGYVQSPPAPVGVTADLLASAADQNLTSWRWGPAAAAVEHQTLRWLERGARAAPCGATAPSPQKQRRCRAGAGSVAPVEPARC